MANKNQPNGGFTPYGAIISSQIYQSAGVIYPGDMLTMNSSGLVTQATAGAGNAVIGCALQYCSAANQDCLVADAVDQEFVAQALDATIAAQAQLGLNYNVIATAGNTQFKISMHELDSSTGATNSNYQLRALRLLPMIGNAFGAQAKIICKINNHQLAPNTVGV